MRVSVIVLNHNKAAYSRMLLDSLLASVGARFQFVLVDNGSRDETPQVLESFAQRAQAAGHGVRVLTFEENVGAITGRNEAMAVAEGDWLAFLDNDIVVRDIDWAPRLVSVLADDPSIGIVSAKLLFPWQPYPIEFAGCDVTVGGRVIYRGRGEPRDAPEFGERRDCPCLISACILFPRALYERLGGLDEAYHPVQYEDIDYCYRAREAGLRCVYVPEVEMYHWEHTTTAGSQDINFQRVTLRNGRTFRRRWGHRIAAEAVLPDEAAEWRAIDKRGLEDVPPPPRRP